MYFNNRVDAGQQLAEALGGYVGQQCSLIALSDGAVVVAEQVAQKLHASIMLLLTENITLPGENSPLAGLAPSGNMTYNDMFSVGEVEEFQSEYNSYIQEQRIEKFHSLNRQMSGEAAINLDTLRHHVVILISDGLKHSFPLDIAADFLKPLKIKKLVIATPLASVPVVDRMHLIGDEICCLSVVENYMDTDHYYDDNTLPPHEKIVQSIQNIVLNWK